MSTALRSTRPARYPTRSGVRLNPHSKHFLEKLGLTRPKVS